MGAAAVLIAGGLVRWPAHSPARRSTTAPVAGGSAHWFVLHPSLLPRQEVAGARIGRFVYVAGGFVRNRATRQVERYDIATNRWSLVKSMPIALNHTAAVAYGGQLYVVDGYMEDLRGLRRSNGLAVGVLLRYDPAHDSWTELAAPPTQRGAIAAGVIGGRLYVAGGFSPTEGELNRLEVYDFATGTWTRGPDMPTRREHVAGAVSGGRLYVIGGRRDSFDLEGNLALVERFDPTSGRWERAPDLEFARSGAAATTVGDQIVVCGGEGTDSVIGQAEVLDPRLERWHRLPDMRTPRHSLTVAAYGERVYAIEGAPRPRVGDSTTVEAFDLAAGATR